ncbi:putative iron superoxide dismutase A [Aspergillus taichungensis]|uniref:superoxide dismutase n=1 Tax=Aspergillus taichungensis TaxID=482145 RepID=A0A2J5HVN5_9EURO|nr:putative iron superoxide dismutase A [Aspergillus taichungensis]
MAASLLRTSTRSALRAGASAAPRAAGVAGTTFCRGKATLPDLQYDFGALEPSISGKIMELHYKNHHQTYVNNYNASVEKLQEAQHKGDIAAQIALKPAINFNGGGHLNHSLFWENLAPKSAGGGEPPSGALSKAVNDSFGSLEQFQSLMNAALAGIQGSGWAWLVKDKQTGGLAIKTYAVWIKTLTFYRTRTPSSASSSPCWVLMPGSTPTTCNTRTARPSTSRPSGTPGERRGFRAFFASALRPKKSRQVLRKGGFSTSTPDLRPSTSSSSVYTAPGARYPDDDVPPMPSLAPLEAHRAKYRAINAGKDTQLGETRDPTAMLHALGVQELEHDPNAPDDMHDHRPPGEPDIASLSADLWQRIADELNPADRASLIFASKTLLSRLGPGAWWALDEPDNIPFKGDFLASQDRRYPHHLLCFPCGVFHRRTQEGAERLQPAGTVNPLFDCPNARNSALPAPRHRITHGRVIYFAFVQLSMRAHRFGPSYGIPAETLSRRWRRDGWWHNSRYYIHRNHLLMRVVSSTFAEPGLTPSAQRMLLYSREDYWPYFSACAHWRDGELMNVCKCALGHIPQPRATAGLQGLEHRAKDKYHGRTHNPNALTTLCGRCRPMRRCPECPSEYLVEVKLTEDRSDPRALRFRQAIVVTRWCDLGDGTSPRTSPEWSACNGENVDQPFDSFARYSKRSIAGTFEAAFTDDTLPGQRMLSMNPKGKKLGEEGTGWY